jgi:hypothetical protein
MKNISLYLNFFIGISWIFFVTWRLILLERIPYVIVQRLSWLQVCIVVSIIVWNFAEVFSLYKLLRKDTAQSMVVKQLIALVNVVYWTPLKAVEEYILHSIPSMRPVLSKVGDIAVEYISNKLRICLVIVLFIVIPRLIVGVCLLVDVLVYSSISSMYKAIPLLIIPILFNTVYYLELVWPLFYLYYFLYSIVEDNSAKKSCYNYLLPCQCYLYPEVVVLVTLKY